MRKHKALIVYVYFGPPSSLSPSVEIFLENILPFPTTIRTQGDPPPPIPVSEPKEPSSVSPLANSSAISFSLITTCSKSPGSCLISVWNPCGPLDRGYGIFATVQIQQATDTDFLITRQCIPASAPALVSILDPSVYQICYPSSLTLPSSKENAK